MRISARTAMRKYKNMDTQMLDNHSELELAEKKRNLLLLAYEALAGDGINRHPGKTFTNIIEKIIENENNIERLEKEIEANA